MLEILSTLQLPLIIDVAISIVYLSSYKLYVCFKISSNLFCALFRWIYSFTVAITMVLCNWYNNNRIYNVDLCCVFSQLSSHNHGQNKKSARWFFLFKCACLPLVQLLLVSPGGRSLTNTQLPTTPLTHTRGKRESALRAKNNEKYSDLN